MADLTNWEVVTGCERLTPGCDNCPTYWNYKAGGLDYHPVMHPEALEVPMQTEGPTPFTVAAGSDLFHEAVTEEFIYEVFLRMCRTPRHYFELGTKRIERMVAMSKRGLAWPDNVVAFTGVEESKYKWRIDALREIDAKNKMIMFGPMVGRVGEIDMTGIGYAGVVVESWGPKPRLIPQKWVDEIEAQCIEQGVEITNDTWLCEEKTNAIR